MRLKRKGNVIENDISNGIENDISNVIENVIENALKTVALLTSLKTARFFIKKILIFLFIIRGVLNYVKNATIC